MAPVRTQIDLRHGDTTQIEKLWLDGLVKLKNIYYYSVTEFEERLKKEFRKKYPNPIEFDWEEFNKGCG